MDIESMRNDFEARFPVPEGVEWNGPHRGYLPRTRWFSEQTVFAYRQMWQVWQAAKEQVVPDGWQLVPKEPTVDMRHAGARSIRFEMPGLVRDIYIATRGYKAMLAAAPGVKP